MRVLVDTSVWVDFFRIGKRTAILEELLDENLVVTNQLILAELIPSLRISGHKKVIQLLEEIECLEIKVNWSEVMWVQTNILKSGHNGIGIPDIIIGQSASQNGCSLFSIDKHFQSIGKYLSLRLFEMPPQN